MNKACAIFCIATSWNEFSKYKRTRQLDEKLTEQYDECSDNYSDLFGNLVS